MRSLGTIGAQVQPDVRLELTSRDGATTYVHCKDDFVSMTPIEWEIPFAGGLGKPSGYEVVLSLPLETIKARLADYNRAEVRLRVDVSSHAFQPHSGRVRSFRRQDDDPNLLTLQIADRFLDDDPVLPVESIVSSFADTHPKELGADTGYPLYYGLHHRPFYFTATDCDIDVLFGPRNVSSENHVNSVWFNSRFDSGDSVAQQHVFLVNKAWAQESGSTNQASGGSPFEIEDSISIATRIWEFKNVFLSQTNPNSFYQPGAEVQTDSRGRLQSTLGVWAFTSTRFQARAYWNIEPKGNLVLERLTTIKAAVTFSFGTYTGCADLVMNSQVDQGGFVPAELVFANVNGKTPPYTLSVDSNFKDGDHRYWFLTESFSPSGISFSVLGSSLSTSTASFASEFCVSCSLDISGTLFSDSYRRFSIFSPVVNSADIAISANPIGILDHVFSAHTATPFLQDQSSDAQVNAQSYSLNCFFADREPLNKIVDEFGRISGTYAWIADSGMMHYRTYQESGAATVDRTLSPDNYFFGSFRPIEAPLGSSITEQDFAREVTVEYGYHFQRDEYEASAKAFPANTALCNSADAAGISQSKVVRTRFIMGADTASYYLGNLVRTIGLAGMGWLCAR